MGNIVYIHNQNQKKDFHELVKESGGFSNWIHFRLVNDDVRIFCGKNNSEIYQLVISKKYDNWEYRVMDFISYIDSANINGVVEITKDDLKNAEEKYIGHSYNDKSLREYEPSVLVHSAPMKAWKSIQKDKCLKSWNNLHQAGLINEKNPIGNLLGDPNEFSDYVMLGSGSTCEVVVSSSDKGEITCDIDTVYQPGVRLYLDAKKIANDGKLVRDGAHLKVKDQLELEEYLLYAATAENIDIDEKNWTPQTFSEKADKVFEDKKFKAKEQHITLHLSRGPQVSGVRSRI